MSSLKYENDGMLRKAEVKDGKVRIPLEACAFYQNVRSKIRGSIPVTLACSVGQVHMPESTALFKILTIKFTVLSPCIFLCYNQILYYTKEHGKHGCHFY